MKQCYECRHYVRERVGPHEWRAGCALRMADFMSATDCAYYIPVPPDHAAADADDRWPLTPAPDEQLPRQVGGDHYVRQAVQPWDAMAAWFTPEQFGGFLLGNTIKYLARFNARAPGKGGSEDLRKAAHYLDRLITLEERAHEPNPTTRPELAGSGG